MTEGRSWNEAYLLRALLMFNDVFQIELWNGSLRAHRPEAFAECPNFRGGSQISIRVAAIEYADDFATPCPPARRSVLGAALMLSLTITSAARSADVRSGSTLTCWAKNVLHRLRCLPLLERLVNRGDQLVLGRTHPERPTGIGERRKPLTVRVVVDERDTSVPSPRRGPC